jgi:hypothetical protein
MSQMTQLIDLFVASGNELTLGEILRTSLAAEYRARMTDLRKEGFTITLIRGKHPSDNLYRLSPPDGAQRTFV